MKKILLAIAFIFSAFAAWAQEKITDELKALSDNGKYDEIVSRYTSNTSAYPAKALCYIGQAYYMKEDNENCLKYMDMAIAKDSKIAEAYYLKGMTYSYMGKFEAAIPLLQTAIGLQPAEADNYSGLGDTYYNLKKQDQALAAYQKATSLDHCPDRPYVMIAQIYTDKEEYAKAIEAYYTAKSKISKESASYLSVLYNLGTMEYLHGDADHAATVLIELILMAPDDYPSYARLIQVFNRQKKYEQAQLYKEKLYAAHKDGKLPGNMQDRFCIDQFKWKDYSVMVFERYENENKGRIYYKHIFYVLDKQEQTALSVQSEFSPISVELKGPKYLLCASKGNSHLNPGIGLKEDTKYENLKALAIKLFEKYLE